MILRNFVVFEGGDGTGTSTQLGILKGKAAAADISACFTCEPTDGPIGRLIRSALRGDTPLCPETVARLFAADRGQHLYGPGGIVELCEAGRLVVCDRFVPSSLVYQGLDSPAGLPEELNGRFPYPELILFFDIDVETAAQRYGKREIRDHYERPDFQAKVHDRYAAILPRYAAEGGSRLVRINASASIEEVAEQVWSALEKLPILGG